MIIGLSGYAQSGKDTVAQILVEDYGYTRVAFADKLRELLFAMDPPVGIDNHTVGLQNYVEVYGWDVAKQHPHVRSMLQNLGLGARQLFGPQFWINEAMKSMLNDPRPDLKYVITDVRFINEADMVKANNGQVWRVKRDSVRPVNGHVSESQMDDYQVDQILKNDGSIEELKELIKVRMHGFS